MPVHRLQYYLEDGTQTATNFNERTGEKLRIIEKWEWEDSFSWFNQHNRWGFSPRYHVAVDIRVTTFQLLCAIRDISELIRKGYKFTFIWDVDEMETATLATTIRPTDTPRTTIEVDPGDSLTVGKYYRMIDNRGYHGSVSTEDQLESGWPGYQNTHVFKVTTDLGSNQYTISPELMVGMFDGAHIMSHRYFTSCLWVNDDIIETWDDQGSTWLWQLVFELQNPAVLSWPAWS